MRRLDLLQLAEQAVILRVGQVRRVQYVIGVIGLVQEAAQLGRALRGPGVGQRPFASSDSTVMAISTSRSSSSADAFAI
jgi:hypothetical protein